MTHYREQNVDDILTNVARELTSENQIEALGKALGVNLPDIERCLQTNKMGSKVTYRGTTNMLRDWRQTVSEEKERLILRRALEEAQLIRIADRYLPDGVYV